MEKLCEFCGRAIEGFKRNTRKYCDDNCKQLAYYARQGMTWGKQALSGKSNLSLNVKPDFTPIEKSWEDFNNETSFVEQIISPITEKQPESVKPDAEPKQNIPVRLPYRKVESTLLIAIEGFCNPIEEYFCQPEYYWTPNTITSVKWVTVRVRCLVENILQLDRMGRTDRGTIGQLSGALHDLTESLNFRCLPANYPFTGFIRELREIFRQLERQVKVGSISFRLSPKRKAQFMAYRFAVADFVPKCRFSELDFSDGVQEGFEEEFDRKTRE